MRACFDNSRSRATSRALCRRISTIITMLQKLLLFILLWTSLTGISLAQDLEPRRWSHVPIDTNYLALAYANTQGDIFFDPVLRIENGTVSMHTLLTSYLRSFNLMGKTARFDVRLPIQMATWEGLLDGEPAMVEREGIGDPRLRWSVNVLGAPALKGKEYQDYRAANPTNTSVGVALAVTVPLGEYMQDKLLNLGGNRYVISPQAGIVHTHGPWSYELTGSVLFFTDNNAFFNGNRREQEPLHVVQGHVVRTFARGIWGSVSAGYDWGGQSRVNGEEKDDRRSDFLYALSVGMPVSKTAAIKASYVRASARAEVGSDSDNIVIAYTRMF